MPYISCDIFTLVFAVSTTCLRTYLHSFWQRFNQPEANWRQFRDIFHPNFRNWWQHRVLIDLLFSPKVWSNSSPKIFDGIHVRWISRPNQQSNLSGVKKPFYQFGGVTKEPNPAEIWHFCLEIAFLAPVGSALEVWPLIACCPYAFHRNQRPNSPVLEVKLTPWRGSPLRKSSLVKQAFFLLFVSNVRSALAVVFVFGPHLPW